jgi:hypothetical protein
MDDNESKDAIINNIKIYIAKLIQYRQKIDPPPIIEQIKKEKWKRYFIQLQASNFASFAKDTLNDPSRIYIPHVSLIEFYIKTNNTDGNADANTIRNILFNDNIDSISDYILSILNDNKVGFDFNKRKTLGEVLKTHDVLEMTITSSGKYNDFNRLVEDIRTKMIEIFKKNNNYSTDDLPYGFAAKTITAASHTKSKPGTSESVFTKEVHAYGNYIILTKPATNKKGKPIYESNRMQIEPIILIKTYPGKEDSHISLPHETPKDTKFDKDDIKMGNLWKHNTYTARNKEKINRDLPVIGGYRKDDILIT